MAIPFERLEGKYEILEKMREGGMGALYKVRHRLLEEVRVVKVMRAHLADDEVLKARFLREAKTAIRLRHANLAQIYDFTVDEEGTFFLVMEYIDGLNLQELAIAVSPVPVGLGLEIAHQTLGVLSYLHRKEIVHRDISPDNVLVTRDDEGGCLIKLIDLGIAKIQKSDDNLTATGTFLGKVRYSSPENFRSKDSEEVGPRSDLYSLGVVLYELLTGRYPIRGTTISSLIAGHLMHEPLPFDEADPDGRIPEALREMIMRSLAKDPEERFASARAFRAKLGELRAEFPVDNDELAKVLQSPSPPTMKMAVVKPGSTQSHLDRHFGMTNTPAPSGAESMAAAKAQTTMHTPVASVGDAQLDTAPPKQQLRALLLGAEKLVQAHHYDEARLQLNAVLEMDPASAEAKRLLAALDAADSKLVERRAQAAQEIEKLINDEQLEAAGSQLDAAIQRLGAGEELLRLRDAIADTERVIRLRQEKVHELLTAAEESVNGGDFSAAIRKLDELQPIAGRNDDRIRELRAAAESGLAQQREAERRQREIVRTAAAIADHLKSNELDQAARALTLARKLYGAEPAFDPVEDRLAALREEHRRREGEILLSAARTEIESSRFEQALQTLSDASKLLDGDPRVHDLMAAAREGLRLQEEAHRRQQAVNDASLSIERLILAGRLETAVHRIDSAVEELGESDRVRELRDRVKRELTARSTNQEKMEAILNGAQEAMNRGDFDGVEGKLQEARKLAARAPELGSSVEDASERLRALGEVKRRRVAIEEAATSIRRRVDNGALAEAERELEVAHRVYGREYVFLELKRRVEDLRKKEREAEVERLMREALGRQTSFSAAITKLETAQKLAPDNEKVQRLLSEIRYAQQRLRCEKAVQETSELMADIDDMIAAGDLKSALAAVNRAIETHGEFPAARALRARLVKNIENEG